MKRAELMVREGCGSCDRVAAQIRPLVAECGAELSLIDVDANPRIQQHRNRGAGANQLNIVRVQNAQPRADG